MAAEKTPKTRGKMWNEEVTRTLIDLWCDEAIQVALDKSKGSKDNSRVYKILLTQLQSKGFQDFSLKEVVNKMKKLRQKYKSEKDQNKKSGNGKRKVWKYFEQMDRFLSQRHNVNPVAIVDTMSMAVKENDEDDDLAVVEDLVKKYGKGEIYTQKCPTCTFEKEIQSAGVHITDGGAVKMYDQEDEFTCPNCDVNVHDQPNESKGDDDDNSTISDKKTTVLDENKDVNDDSKEKSNKGTTIPARRKRKSTIEKSMEAVFEQFKEASNTDFERYKKLEETRIEKEGEFQLQQAKIENQRRQEEREHEFRIFSMLVGSINQPPQSASWMMNQSTVHHNTVGSGSQGHSYLTSNYGSQSPCAQTFTTNADEEKTYFQL